MPFAPRTRRKAAFVERLRREAAQSGIKPPGPVEEEAADEVEKKEETGAKKPKKAKATKKTKAHEAPLVQRVLFSSFIIQ